MKIAVMVCGLPLPDRLPVESVKTLFVFVCVTEPMMTWPLGGRTDDLEERCIRANALFLEPLMERADIALLTGNSEPVARVRMERLGLDGIFSQGQGAFGCEREHRIDLIGHARARAGNRPADETWTVGDTPTDVSSAHAAGVRCVAVASGRFEEAALAGAELVVHRLEELPRSLF